MRLKLDDERKWTSHGTVIGPVDAPRSLNVQTSNGGVYRRNRKHLMKVPSLPVDTPELSAKTTTENHRDEATLSTELQNVATTATQPNDVHGNMSRDVYMTRSGRVVKGLLMRHFILKGNRNNKTFLQRLQCILWVGVMPRGRHSPGRQPAGRHHGDDSQADDIPRRR